MKISICVGVLLVAAVILLAPAWHRAAGFAAARWAVRGSSMTETQQDMALMVLDQQE